MTHATWFSSRLARNSEWVRSPRGIAALMVAYTVLFRNPHYHTPSDTFAHLDYRRMGEAVHGVVRGERARILYFSITYL